LIWAQGRGDVQRRKLGLLLLVEEGRLRLRFYGENHCRLLLCISGGRKAERKRGLGLQLLAWIGCSSKLRASGGKENNRGKDRSAEKQLAASMNREHAKREKSGGSLLVHPPGFVAVAGACFKGGAEE
jgi:hypothetical protein